MPSYHRLDLGFVYTIIPKKIRKIKFTSDIAVSVYNAYNRMNPFFLYLDTQGTVGGGANTASGSTKGVSFSAKQVSLFPLMPSITWNFKF
jgi:hypothetical protein